MDLSGEVPPECVNLWFHAEIVGAIKFETSVVRQMPVIEFSRHIKLEDVCMFVHRLRRGINGFVGEIARLRIVSNPTPVQHGFITVLELIFVTKNNLGLVRQSQPEINPGIPVVHIQVLVETELRRVHHGIVATDVVVVGAPFVKAGVDEAEVGFVHREFYVNILVGNNHMPRHGDFFVGTGLLCE